MMLLFSTTSGYESNVQIPPTDILISISQFLNVPITYFVDLSSEITYSTKDLPNEQREFLNLLFEEITPPSEASKEQFNRQIKIIRWLFELFANH